jgi:HK97 family phage major capsid protein
MKRITPPPAQRASAFDNLGQWLRAIRAATFGNVQADPRLVLEQRSAAAGASEAVPSDGGFAVPGQFASALVERMYLTGEIFSRCAQIPLEIGNTWSYPTFDENSRVTGSRFGGLQTFWEPEAGAMLPEALQAAQQTQKPTFSLSTMVAKKLTGYLYVSDELSLDSRAFDTWATVAFSSELLFVLENSIITGTGAGECQGVLNSPALVAVAKQSGQGSGTVVSANISGMLSAFWSKSYLNPNACWLYNQALLPQLSALTTTVGNAGSESKQWVYRTAADDYDRLCGVPAIPCESCLSPGSQGDLLLVDMNRYFLLMREQRGEVSLHVRFLTSESTFKYVIRCDGQTIDKAPVSPMNAGSPPVATSPFVVLGPR